MGDVDDGAQALLVRLTELGEASTDELTAPDLTHDQTRRRMRLLSSSGLVRFDRRTSRWVPTFVGRAGAARLMEH